MLTASAQDATKTYGEENPTIEVSITGFVLDQTASVIDVPPSVDINADVTSDVGDYDIVLSGAQDNNYDFEYVDGTLTVEQDVLTAAADDASRFEGEENPAFTISYSGFANNDNEGDLDVAPSATCSADASSAPGTYDIVVSGGSDNNYSFEYQNGTLTINEVIDAIPLSSVAKIEVYPNPVHDLLTIKSEQQITTIRIINATGRIITFDRLSGNTLDVSSLPNGMYILQLELKDSVMIEKRFVKQ
jgi:hypothetical protein